MTNCFVFKGKLDRTSLVFPGGLRQPRNGHHKLRQMQLAPIVALALAQPRLALGMDTADLSGYSKVQGFEVDADFAADKGIGRDELEFTPATGWPPPD